MADETNANETEPEKKDVDWKEKYESMRAHSREWERKAKENQKAADELERMREANLTEQQKVEKRAKKAEEELAQLKAEMQRTTDAQEVAASSGVPVALLMHCSDRADMEAFAKEFAEETHVPAATAAPASRVLRDDDGAEVATRDTFADLISQAFGN